MQNPARVPRRVFLLSADRFFVSRRSRVVVGIAPGGAQRRLILERQARDTELLKQVVSPRAGIRLRTLGLAVVDLPLQHGPAVFPDRPSFARLFAAFDHP